jgi:hypothetical protein
MTSDDQFFLDFVSLHPLCIHSANIQSVVLRRQLSSIPHDVKRYSAGVAEAIDRNVDYAAAVVKDTLNVYFPHVISFGSREAPALRRPPPRSLSDRACDWMVRHRAWTAAIVAFFGTGAVLYLGSRSFNNRKRRARRAGNGARKEIVGVLSNIVKQTPSLNKY